MRTRHVNPPLAEMTVECGETVVEGTTVVLVNGWCHRRVREKVIGVVAADFDFVLA